MTETYAKSAGEPDLSPVAAKLPTVIAGAFVIAAALLACLLVLVNRADWWRGMIPASVVSAIAAAVSLLPVMWGLRRDLHKAAAGFLAGIGVRMGISLGGCTLAVLVGGYPAVPTMLLMMGFYITILAAETSAMSSALWPAVKE
jgi:hypothetical protein